MHLSQNWHIHYIHLSQDLHIHYVQISPAYFFGKRTNYFMKAQRNPFFILIFRAIWGGGLIRISLLDFLFFFFWGGGCFFGNFLAKQEEVSTNPNYPYQTIIMCTAPLRADNSLLEKKLLLLFFWGKGGLFFGKILAKRGWRSRPIQIILTSPASYLQLLLELTI